MPKSELDTLMEIKNNPSTTQRLLSRKLNISLGLTNSILQNLIHRGWIKVQKMTGRKILYLITPEGMANVSRLMYSRFQETLHYYHYTKDLLTAYAQENETKTMDKSHKYFAIQDTKSSINDNLVPEHQQYHQIAVALPP